MTSTKAIERIEAIISSWRRGGVMPPSARRTMWSIVDVCSEFELEESMRLEVGPDAAELAENKPDTDTKGGG